LLLAARSILSDTSQRNPSVLNAFFRRVPGVLSLVMVSAAVPTFAATHVVPEGGDLQAALNAAQPGDVIELQSGATYTGNFRLPVKEGHDFIVVRTGGIDGQVPGPGQRIAPMHAPLLAKIRSGTTAAALATTPGTHHWRIELVEFPATARGQGDIITLGGGASQSSLEQMPRNLVFDRVYVHGDPVVGQKRGIALNSAATEIINSYFEDFKLVGIDTQAVAGWNGSGPYRIENNHMEASGENLLFGGADPGIPNLVPSDITIRRNVFTKPLRWRNERWTVKNAFELKNARRVLVEGNVFEHVWSGAQNGFAVLLTVRNQEGTAPWSVVEDVTFRHNIIRNAGGAINLHGYDNQHPSQQTARIRISHNLVYGIDRAVWGGTGDFILMGAMPRDISIEHNTVFHTGMALQLFDGKTPSGRREIEPLVFRGNAMRHNTYGVKGDSVNSGIPTLTKYAPLAVFEHNVLAGGRANQYPALNHFPSVAEFEAQFVDPAAGNFDLVPDSALQAWGNGTPLGADLNALRRAMGGTLQEEDPAEPGTPREPRNIRKVAGS
jgi:Right handed beta helix region